MEARKPKFNNYNIHKPSTGRSRANAPCKRHPKHTQSPGVCAICLSQKLSKLTNIKSFSTSRGAKVANSRFSSSSSSSSYLSSLSSSNASSYSSPVAVNYRRRLDSKAGKSMRVFKKIVGDDVLKKSRSMAFFFHRRKDDEDEINGKKIGIKRGFWSKLLMPRRNKGLMHSRTTRERVITTVY